MTVAAYIAEELSRRGVKYVFGIPGGPSITYLDEFRKNGIEFILTANEASAGFMADVAGRLSDIPGVCHATFGPGATNLSTGVAGALLDRSPVIALTSEMPDKLLKRTVQMNIDHQSLFDPITKATVRLNENNVSDAIADAFDLALSEYPGPVHLGLPSDLAEKEVMADEPNFRSEEWDQELSVDTEIVSLLEYSKKPLLVLGLTAARMGMESEIMDFLSECPMPVLMTPMAKGLIPELNEWYCGILFHAMSDKLKQVIDEADLVIAFGYDQVEYSYEQWLEDTPLVHINTIKTDIPDGIVKELIGRPEGILSMISELTRSDNSWNHDLIKKCKNDIAGPLKEISEESGPLAALTAIRESTPPETILTLDVGSHIHLFGQYWSTPAVDKLLMTNGWSSMGFGIPAAVCAKLIHPEYPVVCVTGDGGFLMMCGELITARRLGLAVVIIVFADRELNLIKLKESARNIRPLGIDLYADNLFGSDIFLGVPVLKCENSGQLSTAITNSLSANGPVIIEMNLNPEEYKEMIIV